MASGPVIALSLAAAAAFAVSTSVKHVSAGEVPDAQDLRVGAVTRLVRATLIHRLWLAGTAADVVGLGLQVVALHFGALAVVQPLLLTGLVFALFLRGRLGDRVAAREIMWAGVLTMTLAGFLVLAGTDPSSAQGADHGPAIIAGVVGTILVGSCVWLGRRQRAVGGRSAALLGIAVGTIYAASAALLKSLTDIVTADGPVAVLTSWQLYLVIVLGAAGLLLNQLAFQAGPLAASAPAIDTTDPLLSIIIGITVYDEPFHHSPAAAVGLAALLLLLVVAAIQLARTTTPEIAKES